MADDIFYSFPGFTGWVPDTADDRDFRFVPTFRQKWGSEENLRTAKDCKGYWKEVYDQENTSSCTANAVAMAYSFELNGPSISKPTVKMPFHLLEASSYTTTPVKVMLSTTVMTRNKGLSLTKVRASDWL